MTKVDVIMAVAAVLLVLLLARGAQANHALLGKFWLCRPATPRRAH
jgi:hypothetical protein